MFIQDFEFTREKVERFAGTAKPKIRRREYPCIERTSWSPKLLTTCPICWRDPARLDVLSSDPTCEAIVASIVGRHGK